MITSCRLPTVTECMRSYNIPWTPLERYQQCCMLSQWAQCNHHSICYLLDLCECLNHLALWLSWKHCSRFNNLLVVLVVLQLYRSVHHSQGQRMWSAQFLSLPWLALSSGPYLFQWMQFDLITTVQELACSCRCSHRVNGNGNLVQVCQRCHCWRTL